MPRVLIQAGHHPDGGGAPGEAAWTFKLASLLATRLAVDGIQSTIVGDWYQKTPPPNVGEDYDLFVSLHYDAAIYSGKIGSVGYTPSRNTGCFADRAAADPMWQASDRAIRAWEAVYPAGTGIALHNERRNIRTSDYYGFHATSARTPGILIEHGVGAPVGTDGYPAGNDAPLLHGQIGRVADLDAQAIRQFLGIVQEPIVEPVEPPVPVEPVEDDMTPEQRLLLDAVARVGEIHTAADMDQYAGRYRDMAQQIISLRELLQTSQQETQDAAAQAEQCQQTVDDLRAHVERLTKQAEDDARTAVDLQTCRAELATAEQALQACRADLETAKKAAQVWAIKRAAVDLSLTLPDDRIVVVPLGLVTTETEPTATPMDALLKAQPSPAAVEAADEAATANARLDRIADAAERSARSERT